jgi:hypothetical protein
LGLELSKGCRNLFIYLFLALARVKHQEFILFYSIMLYILTLVSLKRKTENKKKGRKKEKEQA